MIWLPAGGSGVASVEDLLLKKRISPRSRLLRTTGWLGGVNPHNPAQFAPAVTSGKYTLAPLSRDISQLNTDLISLLGLVALKVITHQGPISSTISQTPFFLFLMIKCCSSCN